MARCLISNAYTYKVYLALFQAPSKKVKRNASTGHFDSAFGSNRRRSREARREKKEGRRKRGKEEKEREELLKYNGIVITCRGVG